MLDAVSLAALADLKLAELQRDVKLHRQSHDSVGADHGADILRARAVRTVQVVQQAIFLLRAIRVQIVIVR